MGKERNRLIIKKGNKMTNTNESGRSMVEMLGVLAIIGVLSVMGIAGYTQAMKKYRINETVAEINMGAMLCGTGQGLGGWRLVPLLIFKTDGKCLQSLRTILLQKCSE